MGEPLRVAVLGAGAAGLALAGRIALHDNDVVVANRSSQRTDELRRCGRVTLRQPDGSTVEAVLDVADRAADAVVMADVIVIAVNSNAQPEVVASLAPVLRDDHIVFLIPGHTGGAWAMSAALSRADVATRPLMVEAPLPFVCRAVGPASVRILQDKAGVALAPFPRAAASVVRDAAASMGFPVTDVVDVLVSGLRNMTTVFQPALMLGNCARVENGEHFPIYTSGTTPAIGRLFEGVDAERCAVASAYGIDVPSAADWLRDSYGSTGSTVADLLTGTPGYRDIMAPSSLNHRFLCEHVQSGLVPLTELARVAGVPTPVCDAVVVLASTLLGTDLRTTGRTLGKLLPEGVPVSGAKSYFLGGAR